MFNPMTVAFNINSPIKINGHRDTLITIWHIDPCKDNTDDSCGWFMRSRHGDENVLAEIKKEFEFNFKHNYWFDKTGKQKFSTIGILVQMYSHASWIYFKRNRKKKNKFMRKYLFDIIAFAENPIDCGGDSIVNRWNVSNEDERFSGLASMVYSDILNKERKWYKHPKWHIHHWKIQFCFLQRFKKKVNTNCDDNLRDTI
jgi:hypothetical protein